MKWDCRLSAVPWGGSNKLAPKALKQLSDEVMWLSVKRFIASISVQL
jgi:hypothetical protein